MVFFLKKWPKLASGNRAKIDLSLLRLGNQEEKKYPSVLLKANFSAPFSGLLSIYFRGSMWALLPTESADLSLFCIVLPFCFPFLFQEEKLSSLMWRNTPPTRTSSKVNFASSFVVTIIYGRLFALQVPDFRLFDSPSCLAPRFSSKGK